LLTGAGKANAARCALAGLLRDLIADKCRQDFGAAGDKVLRQHVVDFSQAEFRQIVREEQPLMLAKPLRDGLRKADLLVMIFKL
jgi:hypothetical protein